MPHPSIQLSGAKARERPTTSGIDPFRELDVDPYGPTTRTYRYQPAIMHAPLSIWCRVQVGPGRFKFLIVSADPIMRLGAAHVRFCKLVHPRHRNAFGPSWNAARKRRSDRVTCLAEYPYHLSANSISWVSDEAVGAVIRAAHALHMDEARPTVKHVAIGRARTLRLNITLGSRTMKAVHVR